MVSTGARGKAIGASRVASSTIMRRTLPRGATVEGAYAVHAQLSPPLRRKRRLLRRMVGCLLKRAHKGNCEQSLSTTLDLGSQLFAWMGPSRLSRVQAPLPLRFASSGWRIIICSWKHTDHPKYRPIPRTHVLHLATRLKLQLRRILRLGRRLEKAGITADIAADVAADITVATHPTPRGGTVCG